MTFYEVVNAVTVQGNIRIEVWDNDVSECGPVETYTFYGNSDLSWLGEEPCEGENKVTGEKIDTIDLETFEDYEVNYIYSDKIGNSGFIVMELERSED